jgi:hypothetical protein
MGDGKGESEMKYKIKVTALLAAILFSLFAFNWIICSSCVVDMLKMGKEIEHTIIVDVVAEKPTTAAIPSG